MIKKILFIFTFSISSIVFSQEKKIESLSAAPNPFTNFTNITFEASEKTDVYFTVKNVLGKTVFKKTIKTVVGKNTLPFYKNDLSTGMYIYSIRNQKKITSKRFVIK
ncbi:T9SS type A sorting domain-containing protein [Polaribacter tangerinus]|uniref:T9SS type A sorting domain-containing protein n=1 Tax=Polaribacter tangerinus TaxID=1920034 RepID=UPI000B4C011A|nr:T9SS type A sorting domain-containing protein [Polaribacter tangerinus]